MLSRQLIAFFKPSASASLGFVCELGFGGERRGRKGLWRGKPLFASFKKTRERFWGVLKGFI